jgi:hypothetical protein
MWLPRGRGADPQVAITVASAIRAGAQARAAETRRSSSLASAMAHALARATPARNRGGAGFT